MLECLRLSVKDVEFGSNRIVVRDAKGQRDRIAPLPHVVKACRRGSPGSNGCTRETSPLDAGGGRPVGSPCCPNAGFGNVFLPEAIERKYPGLEKEWGWQWVFPPLSTEVGIRETAPSGGTRA